MEYDQLRRDMSRACRLLYHRGLVDASGGNLSVRAADDLILVTPARRSMRDISAGDMVEVNLAGEKVGGNGSASSELPLHLEIYRVRNDVNAVIHAHPQYATALAVVGQTVDHRILPEAAVLLRNVTLIPYATPGSGSLVAHMHPEVKEHNVFLLANHGAKTLGKDLAEAFDRMDCLEHTARIQHIAHSSGMPMPLSGAEIEELYELHNRSED